MSREKALKFCRVLLQEHCREGEFDVHLPDGDRKAIAEMLEREFGCKIRWDSDLMQRFTVFCPQGYKVPDREQI